MLYKKYLTETLDENGVIKDVSFNCPDDFNFAHDVVDAIAAQDSEKLAMLWVSSDMSDTRRFTFDDLSKASNKAANFLASNGVKKGDSVMLVLKRHYQFWVAILALHKLGAVAIPATNQLTTKDYVYRFEAADVRAIICTGDDNVCSYVEEANAELSAPVKTFKVGDDKDGWLNFDSGCDSASDVYERRADHKVTDSMLMYFTSGTTGYPKIACHDFSYAIGHIMTARFWHNVNPNGIHFTVSDTGWGKAAWGKLYGQWLCEAAIFTFDFDKFNADELLSLIEKHRLTTFCAPPTIYRFFIKQDLSKYDLSSLEHATTAGEALNPEVFNKFYEATGLRLMEGFGQTETTLMIATFVGTEPKPGSMGKPSPQYKIALLDADGKKCPPGEVGELCINTKDGNPIGLYRGYYRNEEKTNEAWYDGYYHTGDTAWADEDGFLWYVGRTDDLIKSSGYRIGPFEIESVIMELPYVLECAVTGVPDPVRGNVVKATVVLVAGTSKTDELKAEIQKYVKDHTAPYKYPRIVEFRDELPKTISGKIRRVELR